MATGTRNARRTIGRIVLILIAVAAVGFIVIQFIPVQETNPPVVSEPNWTSPEAKDLAVRACYDCHSNETVWPWYSKVAPVSWLISRDVVSGRRHLNFSDWENRRGEAREAGEMAEVINRGSMPPSYYITLHPDADLTDAEKSDLIAELQAVSR